MKFLRGILLSLLSLLFFFSITMLGFAYMLNQTLMDPNFTAAEIDKLDIAALAGTLIQFPDQGTQAFISSATLNKAITESVKASETQIKNELRGAIFSAYDYFLGRKNDFSVVLSLESIKTSMKNNLWEALQKNPPAQVNGIPYNSIPPAQREQLFNQYFDQFAQNIPSSFTLDSSSLDPFTLDILKIVRQYVGFYQFGWKLLIPLILILAVAIILIEANLRSSLRSLGITLFIYGALGIVSDYLLKRFVSPSMTLPGVPASLDAWLTQFMDNVFAPLTVFSIAVASIGAVLFIVSFFIKKKETA